MRALHLLPFVALAACAPDLRPPKVDSGVPDAGEADAGPVLVESVEEDGGTLSTFDATSSEVWVYFDLDKSRQTHEADPGWDLGVQRFKVKTNSGISGDGGVGSAQLDAGYDEVTQAPATGYVVDAVDGDDEGSSEDFAFLAPVAWYAYDPKYHTLEPRPVTYVVRSTETKYFKVAIGGFYDMVGTPGWMRFKWAPVSPP